MLLLYFLILSAFIFSRGFFSLPGAVILFFSCIFFPIFLLKRNTLDVDKIISPPVLLILLSILSLILYGGLYQINTVLVALSFLLLVSNFILAVLYVVSKLKKAKTKIFFCMFFIAIIIRLFMIWSSPNPYIDVYDYLKGGALGLLQGQNPYALSYTQLYKDVTPDFYAYLPGMLLMTLPFVAVLQDPRYAIVASELLIAFMVFKIAKKNKDKSIYALLMLTNPVSLYITEQSYTEPLVLLLLVSFAYFYVHRKSKSLVLSLGLVFATKQYALFLLPLLWKFYGSLQKNIKILGASILFAALIITPFYFWGPKEFIHDAVTLQLNFPPRYEGLTFFSLLYRFGIGYNFIISSLIIGVLLLFIYSIKKINLSLFFFLASFLYLSLFYFNKWAFINYYYLVSQLLLVSAILRENKL